MSDKNLSFRHPNSSSYNWLIYKINYKFLKKISNNLRGHIYDLGCGEMPYKDFILNYANQYTGVDWCSSKHIIKADILADLNTSLPMNNDVADTVVSFSVMEHLCEPQIFLNEAARILKKDGMIILQTPFMWAVHEGPHDYFRYTKYGLEYLLKKSGFSEIKIYSQSGFWVMQALKLNYQTLRLIRGPWLIRAILRILMHIIWAIDQRVAPLLDKYWKSDDETVGYFVVAKKP